MRVLLTGAMGQVGRDLTARLLASGSEVHASDLSPPEDAAIAGLHWHPLDVTDAVAVDRLVEAVRPHRIFHLAALLSARGEEDPQKTYEVNQHGTFAVLEACRKYEVRQLIFTSTIAVFGAGVPEVVTDDAPLRPSTMYGVTKVGGEMLGDYYARRFGVDFRGVRFPGLLGASRPGGGTSDYALLMFVEALRSGTYEAYCRPDTRIPLMFMADAVRGLLELSEACYCDLRRRVYNIAAISPTAQEIAEVVMRHVPGATITFKPNACLQRILDSWPRVLDDRCARDDWGWSPGYDLEGLASELLEQLRNRLQDDPAAFDLTR